MNDALKKGVGWVVPISAIGFLCATCFYAGTQMKNDSPPAKYLVADKNAVILAEVFKRDGADRKTLEKEIVLPVLRVLRRYSDQGYVVIDGARDERGNYTVAALPAGTRDITTELSAEIARKEKTK